MSATAPPWGPREAILGLLILLLVPTGLGLLLSLLDALPAGEPGLGLLLLLAIPGSLLAAGYALRLARSAGAGAAMGLVGCPPRYLLFAALLAPAFVALSLLWGQALQGLGVEGEQSFLLALRAARSPALVAAAVLWGVIGAPVVEELIFRGLVLGGLRQRLSAGPALLLSSLAFAQLHMEHPPAVPVLFVLALALGLLRLRSGSLLPPILLHALNNASAFLMLGLGG
jgi:uncharacterized protein